MAEEAKILATIPRSATEQLQISINSYKEKKYLDLRIYYTTDDGANWLLAQDIRTMGQCGASLFAMILNRRSNHGQISLPLRIKVIQCIVHTVAKRQRLRTALRFLRHGIDDSHDLPIAIALPVRQRHHILSAVATDANQYDFRLHIQPSVLVLRQLNRLAATAPAHVGNTDEIRRR